MQHTDLTADIAERTAHALAALPVYVASGFIALCVAFALFSILKRS